MQQAGLFCPAEPDHIGPMASSKPSHSEQSPSRTSSADSRRAPAQENASSLSGPSDSLVMVPQSEDYEIQEPAGRDTNGTVWKALDRVGQRTVALKRIRPELAESRELIARIRRDVKTFAGFQHPGIVQVFDLKKDDDGLFLVLEWVDGWNLTETMQTSGPLEELRAVKGIARVADALQAAHEQKITHRNIKPANILLAPHGKLKLTDFGLVRVDVESLADSLDGLCRPGTRRESSRCQRPKRHLESGRNAVSVTDGLECARIRRNAPPGHAARHVAVCTGGRPGGSVW